MAETDEFEIMKKMDELLEQLSESARGRALNLFSSKYAASRTAAAITPQQRSESSLPPTGAYGTFAELFDAALPNGDRDKALVAAYWAQVCNGTDSFPSQTLNDELKDLGHRISNITDALTRLKSDRPALILQLKKSGTSKQARKTYKLTQEGIRRVQSMIAGNNNSANAD